MMQLIGDVKNHGSQPCIVRFLPLLGRNIPNYYCAMGDPYRELPTSLEDIKRMARDTETNFSGIPLIVIGALLENP